MGELREQKVRKTPARVLGVLRLKDKGNQMIEAWQVEHRPWMYFFLRRFELTRWTLQGKVFHREARWYARLAALYLAFTGYETERCCFCGWKVGIVWWCDDQMLWETVTGWQDGEGISCIQCFSDRADRRNLALKWHIGPLCGYTEEEWRRIIASNQKQFSSPVTERHGQAMDLNTTPDLYRGRVGHDVAEGFCSCGGYHCAEDEIEVGTKTVAVNTLLTFESEQEKKS